jgi:carboxymethylenebutenolidase
MNMDDVTGISGLSRYPLARRGFVMTSLISGFTLATRVLHAQAIHTDSAGLSAGEAKVTVTGGAMPVYYARPATGTRFPVILVNEEIFGIHEYIADMCRRFAKLGYLAVAPEIYFRNPDFPKMTDTSQIVREVVSTTPDDQVMADLDATLAWATANGGDANAIGEIGFCRGGRTSWLYAAHSTKLKAAVACYGQLGGQPSPIQPKTALDLAGEINCPMLGLYGGKDGSIPVEQVNAAEAKAKAARKTVEIVIYPDAGHAFLSDYRPTYVPAAAEDAWKRALSWFKQYGVAAKA